MIECDEKTAAELRRLELMLLKPEVRCNRASVEELLAEDFLEFGSSGRVWRRAAVLEMLATETCTPPEVEDFTCRMVSEDVALVTYCSVRRDGDGARSDVLRSSLWVRQQGKWKLQFHQGTRTN